MDDADRAQQMTEIYEGAALQRRLPASAKAWNGVTPFHVFCSDCETRIPPERLRAHPGAERCVKCQTQFECPLGYEKQGRA